MDQTNESTSTKTVLVLFFLLVGLILLLIVLYKKLNRESKGEYTIRRFVYKEGGLRDQVRGAVMFLETRLGVQLWPHSDSEEDGEEMQEIQDEEGQLGEHSSQRNDSVEDEQEEEDNVGQSGEMKRNGGDTSDDNSSVLGSDPEEQTSLIDQLEAKGEMEEKVGEKGGDRDCKGEASGGAGLQINLSQFSGSAIWSGEGGNEASVSDVTAL